MDKNILAEYQKRIEEMQYTQEHAKVELEEAIEARKTELETKIRTEQNELAQVINESQVQLEELQGPVNMDDVSRRQIIDRRGGKTAIREYSQDEEGKLLREFDIAVNDSAVTNEEIEQIVEALRKERERIREEQRKALNAKIKSAQARQEAVARELSEGQEKIATEEAARKEEIANDTEATKNQLLVELQEARKQIEANIQSKRESIEQEMAKFGEAFEEGKVHLQALALYKDETSKVYTAAKAEHEKCVKKVESAQNRVKRLSRKIAHLEQDLAQVDELLDSLLTDEISRQEDEMWKEYRAEQEKQTAKMEENKDYIMNAEMELHNGEEKAEEEKTQKQTEREIRAYGDTGITPEDELPLETYKVPLKEKDAGRKNPQPPTAGQKPQVHTEPKSSTDPKPNPNQKPEKWKVESVAFSIEGGSNPAYKVIASKGEEKREFTSNEVRLLDEKFDPDEIKTLTDKKGIYKAEMCYDKGLATFLEQIDVELGTESLKEYQNLLRDREMIYKYPERYENCMKIDYDFSGLRGKVNSKMKKLQKIAKECGAKGVANYQKKPNILKRILRSITNNVKLLKEAPLNPNASAEELRSANREREMEEGLEDRSYELDIDALKEYPDFSPEVAREQLEEAERTVQEKVRADEAIDAAKKWREEHKIDVSAIESDDVPPKKEDQPVVRTEEAEKPKKDDDVIEVDSEDVRLLDEDGCEIE